MATKKLPSEINTTTMQKRVLAAARKKFQKRKGVSALFEHGHWWVNIDYFPKHDIIKTYDVVDANGFGAVNGFGFERM